jgi:hypothetical protein
LSPQLAQFKQESSDSMARQRAIEAGDDLDFEAYLERYFQ